MEIIGFEYEQSEDDKTPRLHLRARYGLREVLIPLDAVYVDGDSPYEEMSAASQAAERLASALLEWSSRKER